MTRFRRLAHISLLVDAKYGVRGKMFLQSHGKHFFHYTVDTFLRIEYTEVAEPPILLK